MFRVLVEPRETGSGLTPSFSDLEIKVLNTLQIPLDTPLITLRTTGRNQLALTL